LTLERNKKKTREGAEGGQMEGVNRLRKLFDYDLWGNREALGSLEALGEAAEWPRRLFCHVIGAQRIWLSRFETPDHPSVDAWSQLTLAECRDSVEELHRRWTGLLNQLTPEKLASDLVYRNTKGVEFRTPIEDVLMHLVMHSAYHRGQVAAAVREAGGVPAATDYVVYVRKVLPGLARQEMR
jgi:uncharacterized damage-inducible protein DinB